MTIISQFSGYHYLYKKNIDIFSNIWMDQLSLFLENHEARITIDSLSCSRRRHLLHNTNNQVSKRAMHSVKEWIQENHGSKIIIDPR